MSNKIATALLYGISSIIGIVSFIYPFLMPVLPQTHTMSEPHANDAPLVLTTLVFLCFLAILFEVQGHSINTHFIALLGMLVSMNAVLRFVEVAIPGPGGFSPIFVLIITTGYVFGGRFGFLMGTLTLIASAIITGGIGPWLPYQMITAGWVGMSTPLCKPFVQMLHRFGERAEVFVLALFGGVWGFLYGAIMNVWFWPLMSGPAEQQWQPGMSAWNALQHFATFYLVTSVVWDGLRAVGNIVLIVVLGGAIVRVLRRFKHRFDFRYEPMLSRTASQQTPQNDV